MNYRINIVPIGVIALVLFILIDFYRFRTKNLLRRIVLYTFIFYIINVLEVTTGGIYYPPLNNMLRGGVHLQLKPFRFITDWIREFSRRGLSWFFWNSVKLSMLNVVMLFPLGLYLPILFNVRNIKRITIFIALTSFVIEIYQGIFSRFGLVFARTSNIDDLILNTFGGIVGYCVYKLLLSKWIHAYIKNDRNE